MNEESGWAFRKTTVMDPRDEVFECFKPLQDDDNNLTRNAISKTTATMYHRIEDLSTPVEISDNSP